MTDDYTAHESDLDHEWSMSTMGPWTRQPRDECPQCGEYEYGWLVYFHRVGAIPILWFYEMRHTPKLACTNCGYIGQEPGYVDGVERFKRTDFAEQTGLDEAIEEFRNS